MVGGGSKRTDGSFTVSNSNVFAALESLRKKKKSVKATSGKSKETGEEKPQVYWAPTPLTVKSWADVGDEDDDDYYATTAPPQALWPGSNLNNKEEERQQPDHVEEIESEDDLLDEDYDDVGEDENELVTQEQPEPERNIQVEISPAPKETEKQLSKKERKKKELAELDAILADFGLNPKEKAEDEPPDVPEDKKEGQVIGEIEMKYNVPAETKNAKKKKKKDRATAKEVKDQPNNTDAPNGQEGIASTEEAEEDASAVDMKERLKKMASSKKKKSNKDMDASARAASAEAAARATKLAAAKKKDKNHYNQQPIR